ncbi:MAG: DUF2079 domain-containing protein, partial [Dehalococcoidia bacterium]|nr:DUF2079 domain-containing protein [Dehalococcoidia bacterium]
MAYTTVFGALSILRHEALNSNAYDLAIFDQAIWNTSRGRWFAVSIKLEDLTNPILLGDHFSPALALLAPVYWVWSDVRALLIVQTLLFAVGAFPIYRLARHLQLGAFGPPALVF